MDILIKNFIFIYHVLIKNGLNNGDANWIEEEETTQVGKQEIDCKVQINLGLF